MIVKNLGPTPEPSSLAASVAQNMSVGPTVEPRRWTPGPTQLKPASARLKGAGARVQLFPRTCGAYLLSLHAIQTFGYARMGHRQSVEDLAEKMTGFGLGQPCAARGNDSTA